MEEVWEWVRPAVYVAVPIVTLYIGQARERHKKLYDEIKDIKGMI